MNDCYKKRDAYPHGETVDISDEPDTCWRCKGTEHSTIGAIEFEEGSVWQEMECNDCNGTWQIGYLVSQIYITE